MIPVSRGGLDGLFCGKGGFFSVRNGGWALGWRGTIGGDICLLAVRLRRLRGRGRFGEIRGCRSCLAQPPANGWHPSGMGVIYGTGTLWCFNQQGFRLQRSHAYQPRVKPWERGQRDGCVLKERRRGVDRARVRRSERCGVPSERGDWGRGRPRALLWAGMHCPCGANGCPCSCLHLLRGWVI